LNADTVPSASLSDYKKVLILFGSPHKEGHTKKLLQKHMERLDKDAEIHMVYAYDEQVKPCFGCGFCAHGLCACGDMYEVYDSLEDCDLLIVASPVYNLSFPAPLKNILDRFQVYWVQRFVNQKKPPIEKHKDAWVLLTCGSDNREGFAIMNRQFDMMFTVLNTTKTLTEEQAGTDKA